MALSVFAAAAEAPSRPALVAAGRTLTYTELAERTRGAVSWLRTRGFDAAPGVALVATNETPALEMLHALIALGIPALPVHPRLTAAERAAVTGAAAVIPPGRRTAPAAAGGPDPEPPPDDERPLAVLSTSGTTGRPRGVILSRRAFAASAASSAANLGWEEDDRWLLRLPVAHVGGLSVVTRCLLARRTVVLSDASTPRELAATIGRDRITLLSLVPTLLWRLLELRQPAWDPPPHVRAILVGGAAASPALLGAAADRGWPVLTTYGLTEACSQVTTQPYGSVNRGELGAGRPLRGTEVRIGEDGEIEVRGPTLLSGYVPGSGPADPFLPGGWLPTGDRGRLDAAGNLHVLGRRADRIVTGGENVDPVEVEHALERLPGVERACVFGMPDEEWGAVVCAAVVADARFDRDLVATALSRELAPFKRPRLLARVDALPLNATGKVDRAAAARLASGRLEPL